MLGGILKPREENTLCTLAGVELVPIIVASMGVWSGFMLKTELIIQGCFCYIEIVCVTAEQCLQSQGLFSFSQGLADE